MAPHNPGRLPAPSPELREYLATIIGAARRLSEIGSTRRAVDLLRSTADRISRPRHIAAGLHALADLFAAHPPQRGKL
jgi:hypothetical protein